MKKLFLIIASVLLPGCSTIYDQVGDLLAFDAPHAPKKEEVRHMYTKDFWGAEATLISEEFFELLHARWELKQSITDQYIALTKTTSAGKSKTIRTKIQQLNQSLQIIETRLTHLLQTIKKNHKEDDKVREIYEKFIFSE